MVSETTRKELLRYAHAVPQRVVVTPEGVSVPPDLPYPAALERG